MWLKASLAAGRDKQRLSCSVRRLWLHAGLPVAIRLVCHIAVSALTAAREMPLADRHNKSCTCSTNETLMTSLYSASYLKPLTDVCWCENQVMTVIMAVLFAPQSQWIERQGQKLEWIVKINLKKCAERVRLVWNVHNHIFCSSCQTKGENFGQAFPVAVADAACREADAAGNELSWYDWYAGTLVQC